MELDHNNLLAGSNNAELAEYVKQQFDEDDFDSLKEAEEMLKELYEKEFALAEVKDKIRD